MAQTTQKTPRMPADLIAAMENEDLTEDQLREIVRIEAAQLGFSLDDAIDLARANRLPKDADGTTLQFHIFMLLDCGATPIQGRSPQQAAQFFCMHLNNILHQTVTQAPLSFDLAKENLVIIRFRGGAGEAGATLLRTVSGPSGRSRRRAPTRLAAPTARRPLTTPDWSRSANASTIRPSVAGRQRRRRAAFRARNRSTSTRMRTMIRSIMWIRAGWAWGGNAGLQ